MPPCAGDQCRQQMPRQLVVMLELEQQQHRQGDNQMLLYALPTMFGVAAARMALFTALGLPPWPSPMYLQCMPTLLSAEALSCSQAGWSTASCQRQLPCQRQQQCCQTQVRHRPCRPAVAFSLIQFKARRRAGLIRRPQGTSSAGPGLPPTGQARTSTQHLGMGQSSHGSHASHMGRGEGGALAPGVGRVVQGGAVPCTRQQVTLQECTRPAQQCAHLIQAALQEATLSTIQVKRSMPLAMQSMPCLAHAELALARMPPRAHAGMLCVSQSHLPLHRPQK